MSQKGFSTIIIAIIVGAVILFGGTYVIVKRSGQPVGEPAQGPGQVQANLPTQSTPLGQPSNQPLSDKCGDGVCDNFEKQNPNECPKDCQASIQQPVQQSPAGQSPQQQGSQAQPPPSSPTGPSGGFSGQEISVKATGAKYKTVSSKPTSGWFKTGQDADILLSGIDFNNTGGPLLFNHPGTAASDGTHLLLADRNNNRILIWNKLPTGNTPPDIVLGQKNFTANNPGTGLDEMNWPVSVSVGGGKVVVADTYNHRILIWNSFPTKNGQLADLVINNGATSLQGNFKRNIFWPWGAWTDGKKLAISATGSGHVLIWNNFPTQNDQPADIYLTAEGKMGTPRTITSDGVHLIVGDHNPKVTAQGSVNFFWKNWPTQNDEAYSFFMSDPVDPRGAWMQGAFTADGKLIMLGATLHIWNSFPESASDKPDLSVGQSGGPSSGSGYRFVGGDGSGLAVTGNRLYISLSNGNRIVGFNSLPTKSSAKPDFAIGAPDINTNTLDTNFIMSNPVPATDGKSLFISSDFDNRLYVYKNLPDESDAHPDFVYQGAGGWDNELFENKLAVAGQNGVFIWNKLPTSGEKPDLVFASSIGDVRFQDLKGVAMDDKYFYLADSRANKVYVWQGIPSQNSNPLFSLNIQEPGRLSSDGNYLAVTRNSNHSIDLYSINALSANSKPIASVGGQRKFNLPQYGVVSRGHFFVGDTGYNKIRIWKDIADAIAGKDADVILGGDNSHDALFSAAEIGKNKLFWPAAPAFDGSFLWVGEFKFSERLLRFSIKP